MELVKETSPHIKRKDNLTWMLLDVVIALIPVLLCAYIVYPLDALRTILLSVATMELCEFVFCWIKNKTPKAFKTYNILSALISAIIYSLAMPVDPGWSNGMGYVIVIFGAFIGIVVGKLLFGGFGNNIFNPAALGMIVARLSWGGHMTNVSSAAMATTDKWIHADVISAGGTSLALDSFSKIDGSLLSKMFLGQVPSSLGEGFKIAILIGLAYLLIRRTIDWRTFLSYAGTFVFLMFFASIFVSLKLGDYSYLYLFTAYEILAGGFLFGAVYMITDPVTGPVGRPGRVLFGAFGAIVAVFIRLFASAPEGVGYSILFANMIAPALDYPGYASATWKKRHFITLGAMLGVAVLIVCLTMNYKEGIVK